MAYGVTATGFSVKTYEVIVEELHDAWRAAFGASSLGERAQRLLAIVAERLAEVWELAEDVYAAFDPDGAVDDALDALCALTGTTREPASESTVTLTLTGTGATVVPAGSTVETASTAIEFTTDEDATLAELVAWANTTAYVLDDRRSNGGNSYICITAGTSAGSGGPTTTADDITDGTVHWRYLGEGTAAVDVTATATATGPLVATSGDLTEIVTPVSGWLGVTNLLDADLGTDLETDEDLRVRRGDELAGGGASTADAIRAAVLDVADVTTCRVFYNDSDVTDADGVPPHAVEVLVQGGADQDIWDALLASVAAGIATHGDEAGTAEDSEGVSHDVYFSRPEARTVYAEIVLTKDPDTYPTDGDAQVKAAIVALEDVLGVGYDVTASRVSAAVFSVTGVLDVTDVDIGTSAAPPDGTTITVSTRQVATFDTSRITVTSSDGTP